MICQFLRLLPHGYLNISWFDSTILSIIALVLELVSYILYLRALSKGKKMLAK